MPGVQQTKVHSASSDEVFNQLSTHVTACTSPHLFVASNHLATKLDQVAKTFPTQSYRSRARVIQSLHQDPYSLSPSGSSGSSGPGPRATDPAAHYGPRTWAMGGQEKKKDAGRGRNKKGRKGEAARQGEQISSHSFNSRCCAFRLSRRSILPWTLCSSASIWWEGEGDERSGSTHKTSRFPGPLVAGPHVS